MFVKGLKAPVNLNIDFKPSSRQFEVWKRLQPECHVCGGKIISVPAGKDRNGNPTFKPMCQECGLENIPEMVLSGGAAGGGKCLSINSHVCTPFGFRRLIDLKVGDIISNPCTGGQQRVVWIHPQGKFPFYRIHFVDGTSTECSEGHLWRAHQSRKKSKKAKYNPDHYNEYGDDRIWSTKSMYEWYQRKKQGINATNNLIIPLSKPIEFANSTKLPIEPYILGALIGDGCMAHSTIDRGYVRMDTMDGEIKARFEAAGYDMSHASQKANNRSIGYAIRDKGLIESLYKLGIAGNKSKDHVIPRRYMVTSVKNRIELMQGLIDTDGYVDDRGHIVYTSISKQLAEDVAWVVRSLGGVATITSGKAGYKLHNGEYKQCNDAYDVQIRTKMNPDLCGLTRKKERARYEFNGGFSELGKRITDIEYIGEQESFCITVDDPSGLYIADNFTVTHNSYLGACWLISCCIRWPDMRMVVARKTLKSLKDSTWATICSVVNQWGLVEGENYKINNLSGEMIFWNGSKISMKELAYQPSDPDWQRLGSQEISGAFCDEIGELEEKAIDILFSRIRHNIAATLGVPKMLLSCNPCLGWVRSRFVQDDDGNPVNCRKYESYIPFSVFDNPSASFREIYLQTLSRISDEATKQRLLYGNWSYVDSNESAAYWSFSGDKHLITDLREKVYDPLKPLVISLDFNVAPFMSALALQIDYTNKKVYILEEILGRPENKENNTPKLAEKISKKYLSEGHMGGITITGDPAGLARSTQTEEGVNNFTIIMDHMHPALHATKMLLPKQPPQKVRLEFINKLFSGEEGWEILVDMRCRRLTEDFIYQKKTQSGDKDKSKVTDPKLGVKYEKYGHLSDAFDYAICLLLKKEWGDFQRGGKKAGIATTSNPIYGNFEY